MGSVIDYIDCPNCSQEAYSDFYYKTGEEYVNCQNCGYHYSATYKTNDEGEYVTKDGTDNYEFENLIMETHELKNPYGAYKYKHRDAIATNCGSLENEDDYNKFKSEMELNKQLITYAIVNRFIDNQLRTEILLDSGPKFDGAGFSEEDREAK
jgi:Zn ribbon nucleic-acid-binding protein